MQERNSSAEQELRESTESTTLGGLEGGRPVAAEKDEKEDHQLADRQNLGKVGKDIFTLMPKEW